MKRLLIVAADQQIKENLERGLSGSFVLHWVPSVTEASEQIRQWPFDGLLLGESLSSKCEKSLICKLRRIQPDLPVIVLRPDNCPEDVEAMEYENRFQLGNHISTECLQRFIQQVIGLSTVSRRLGPADLAGPESLLPNLTGDTPFFRACIEQTRRLCCRRSPVLFVGETGSGRELLARHLHAWDVHREAAFVVVQGSFDEAKLAFTLFGSLKREGRRQVPQRGALDLARVGSVYINDFHLAPDGIIREVAQVIAKGSYARQGDISRIPTEARFLFATTDEKLLFEKIARHPDLASQLRTGMVRVPSLSERRDDIPLLVSGILNELKAKLGSRAVAVDPDAMTFLQSYSWPGNLAELRAALELCLLTHRTASLIRVDMLPTDILCKTNLKDRKLCDILAMIERSLVARAMHRAKGIIPVAAEILGITRRKLGLRLQKYDWPAGQP